jgi:hypothetical protein
MRVHRALAKRRSYVNTKQAIEQVLKGKRDRSASQRSSPPVCRLPPPSRQDAGPDVLLGALQRVEGRRTGLVVQTGKGEFKLNKRVTRGSASAASHCLRTRRASGRRGARATASRSATVGVQSVESAGSVRNYGLERVFPRRMNRVSSSRPGMRRLGLCVVSV